MFFLCASVSLCEPFFYSGSDSRYVYPASPST